MSFVDFSEQSGVHVSFFEFSHKVLTAIYQTHSSLFLECSLTSNPLNVMWLQKTVAPTLAWHLLLTLLQPLIKGQFLELN